MANKASLNPLEWLKQVKIKKKLLVVSLLVSIVPLVVIGSIAYLSARDALTERIGRGLEDQARSTLDKIDRNIYERKQNIRVWAQLVSMQDILIDDDDENIKRELTRLKSNYGTYQDIFVFNEEGGLTSSSNAEYSGDVTGETDWFKNSLNGEIDIQDVGLSALTGELALSFSAPVRADYDNSKVLGVLTSRFDWKKIYGLVDSVLIGGHAQNDKAYLVLLNKEGQVISAPGFMRDNETILKKSFSGLLSSQTAENGESGYLIEKIGGRKMLVGYAPSTGHSEYAGLGWSMLVMQDAAEALAQVNALKYKILIVSVLTALISLMLSRAISNSIIGPINNAVRVANRLAKGDLSVHIETTRTDEAGQLLGAMGNMVDKLRALILGVSNTTARLANASVELSSSSTQIASGAGTQSEQTDQIATAMEKMNATVIGVAMNSQQASDSATEAQSIAVKGGEVVEQAIVAMKDVSESTAITADTVKKLGNSSEQIGTIVSVINDIADQTNLLALNAAIEAARAGDQGRGFAVVADEVRKLAERTTSATKEISTMITSIQSETSIAVGAMDEGAVKVENGVKLANEAGDALKRIVSGVENVTSMIGHIAVSAEEQSSTTEQITRTMDSIAGVARTNVNTVGEVANASSEMERLANELKDLVSNFKISRDGDARSGFEVAPGAAQGLDRTLSAGTGMRNAEARVLSA